MWRATEAVDITNADSKARTIRHFNRYRYETYQPPTTEWVPPETPSYAGYIAVAFFMVGLGLYGVALCLLR